MKPQLTMRHVLHFFRSYQLILFFMIALGAISFGILSVYEIINDTADPGAKTGQTVQVRESFNRSAIDALKRLEAPTNVEPLIKTGQRINPFSNAGNDS